MTDLKALAVRAADWINETPFDVFPRVRGRRLLDSPLWYVSICESARWREYEDTDKQLIDRAKAMGWNPEPAADPAPVFPDGIFWQSNGPLDTDRAAAARKALSGPSFASFTPEQRADAMQAVISFDIHCKPETAITVASGDSAIQIELRTGTHLSTVNAWPVLGGGT